MKLATGNMWSAYPQADLFLITTNSTLKNDGCLVMGTGIALEAAQRYLVLPHKLGIAVARKGPTYGLLVAKNWPTTKIGAFQVKTDWRQPASLDLIALSTKMLIAWCAEHPDAQVHLNFPGIGAGKLSANTVTSIIKELPDTVTVWRK
jgi:hypothetical protein